LAKFYLDPTEEKKMFQNIPEYEYYDLLNPDALGAKDRNKCASDPNH